MKKPLLIILFCVFASATASAIIDIPQNLTKVDREESLRILGFGTSNKALSDPYPLGGYSGFEIAVSVIDFPVQDLKNLGNKLGSGQTDVSYTSFSIGKGLYNNVDIFLNLTPYLQNTQMSQYGGELRWSFYQAESLPLSFSVLFTANSTNISNQLSVRTVGSDVLGALNVNRVALYAGFGSVTSAGDFIGGTRGLTDSGYQENESVWGYHYLGGVNLRLTDFFLSGEIDHYRDTVYSGKFGIRL